MSLDQMLHDAFVAWTTRHREELDIWEREAKAEISRMAISARRSIARRAWQSRIRLYVTSCTLPPVGDPDFPSVISALRNLVTVKKLRRLYSTSAPMPFTELIACTYAESQLKRLIGPQPIQETP